MIIKQQALTTKSVTYNNSTSATINTWSLAIPSNPNRQGWMIENISSNIIKIGVGDEFGNVTEFLALTAGEVNSQTGQVITSDLFVQSGTASQSFLASEYIT
jgi:hypothetical protein